MNIMVSYIIFAVAALFFLFALIMLLPSQYRKSREVAFAERKKVENVVECESTSLLLCIVRYLTVWCMGFDLFLYFGSIWAFEEPDIRFVLVFIALFLLHYPLFVQLDRKFYISRSGLWINEIAGEPIMFDEIEINKAWFSTAPFSGLAGNLLINFSYNQKKYTALLLRFDEGDELYERYKEELSLLTECLNLEIGANKRQQGRYRKIGLGMIIAGAIMALAIIPAVGIAGDSEFDDVQEGQVIKQEMYSNTETVEVYDSGQYLYKMSYRKPVINVYDTDDEQYQYSYIYPPGEHGEILYAVIEDTVYIKNKEDVVYVFKGEKYLDAVKMPSLNKNIQNHLINSEAEHQVIEQDTIFVADYFFIIGVIGIIICIIGGFIFNKGRFSLKKEEQ